MNEKRNVSTDFGTNTQIQNFMKIRLVGAELFLTERRTDRVDNERKSRSSRQRSDIGKYSFVNRTIQHWNQLPTEVLGILPCKPITFKKRVRKVIIELKEKEVKCAGYHRKV